MTIRTLTGPAKARRKRYAVICYKGNGRANQKEPTWTLVMFTVIPSKTNPIPNITWKNDGINRFVCRHPYYKRF